MIRSSPGKPRLGKKTAVATVKTEVRIFVSYSHKDEASRIKLETHLAQLKREGVSTWFDRDLNAGEALDLNIARELRRAHVFVALFSPDYLASHYCWEVEYKRAMGRRSRGTMRVVAVLLRPCDWRNTQAANFKLLPKDGRPVSEWRPADKAYDDAANGIREIVRSVRLTMPTPSGTKLKGKRPIAEKPAKKPPASQKKVPVKPLQLSSRRKPAKPVR